MHCTGKKWMNREWNESVIHQRNETFTLFYHKIIVNKKMIFKSYVKLSWEIPIISSNRNWLLLIYIFLVHVFFWFLLHILLYFFSLFNIFLYDSAPTSRFIEFIFVLFLIIHFFFAICKFYYYFFHLFLCGFI